MKIARLVLLFIVIVSCVILIVPSHNMIDDLEENVFNYENLTGEITGYIIKKNAEETPTTYYELFDGVSTWQVIALAANVALAVLLMIGEFAGKRIPLVWLVAFLVSILQINILGQSTFCMILSFVPAIGLLAYKIIGGNRNRKAAPAETAADASDEN